MKEESCLTSSNFTLNVTMVNIVGFSRGGTHLFWCFVASHSELNNAKLEVNDLVGRSKLGFRRKLVLEINCILGLHSTIFDGLPEKDVYKAVCSWYPSLFFKVLRRHDPMKYLESTSLKHRKTIFLVKSFRAQSRSWSSRGAPDKVIYLSYSEHISRWKKFSERHQALFVSYEDFCESPQKVVGDIWKWLGLKEEILPHSIEIKRKRHKFDNLSPKASSDQRFWESVRTSDLIESLRKDGVS